MTAQDTDTCLFRDNNYSLIELTEGSLASPEQYGMVPVMIETACRRGFYATYELTEEAFYLRELTLRELNGKYLPIGDIQAEVQGGIATYHGLSEVIYFTGKMRLAKDYKVERYFHVGFQKPFLFSAFTTVLDITLKDGKVIDIADHSQEIKQNRIAIKKYCESGSTVPKTFGLKRLE